MIINPIVVDISHYDDVEVVKGKWTGFAKAKEFGIAGVVNKATEGPGMVDKSFANRRPHALEAGLLYGAYHFLRPGDPNIQADHFLEVCGSTDGLLLALDHEDPRVPLSSAEKFARRVRAKVGRYPVLYSGFLIKQQLVPKAVPFWKKLRLWLAHYSSRPKWPSGCWPEPWLWQFTGDGVGPLPHNVQGITISGGLDINSYDGTPEQLAAEWAQ